ncbi:MAG: hypothetical protein J6V64_05850, partial [Burkholderiaceae bacterium]|nr:hypothetical protein [Burkholderiaceae bacterium]
MSITFDLIFLAALAFYFVVQSLVCLAEIVHLKRTINQVPAELIHKVTLAQHQKAAHYDIARTALNWLEVTVTTALILVLTEGDIINMVSDWLMMRVGDAFAFRWMLPATIGLLFVLVDLPFCWYKEFRLREAYGYCRMHQKKWFHVYFLETLVGWLAVLPFLWVVLYLWRHTDQAWWLIGWGVYCIYLVFHLGLAKRLLYVLHTARSTPINDETLINALAHLGEDAKINVTGASICRQADNDDLPPAFAYGHNNNVRLFFRADCAQRMQTNDLVAIAAHALARNRSHMYLQSWLVCAAVGFVVFAFLSWLAPQSWFLDEIGFRVYGPGPYYGSLMTFAIVALPVLLFPFKLPMDLFLRRLIFASDTFALKYTGLAHLTHALIELTPSPIRHSTVTLGIFDLLFSHEPSLMARIKRARVSAQKWEAQVEAARLRDELSTVRQQTENVKVALATRDAQRALAQKIQNEADQQTARRAYEAQLIEKARLAQEGKAAPAAINKFEDPYYETAEAALANDNSHHATYGMSLMDGVRDLIRRYKEWYASRKVASTLAKGEASTMIATAEKASETPSVESVEEKKIDEPIVDDAAVTDEQPMTESAAESHESTQDTQEATPNDTVCEEEKVADTASETVEETVVEEPSDGSGDEVADQENPIVKKTKKRQQKALQALTERQE